MAVILEDFLFSLNTVLPVFIIVLVGYYIRRRGTVDEDFINCVSNVVFYYALPAGIFLDVAKTDVRELANPRFVILSIVGTAAVFAGAWLVMARKKDRDPRSIAASVHAAFRGNYVYVGVPIIQNILGRENLVCSILVVTFTLSFYNVLAVLVLSVYGGDMRHLHPAKLLLTILKNPMIIATLLGVAWAALGLPLPIAAQRSLSYLKSIASPLALIMIGARMVGNSSKGDKGLIGEALLFKLVLGPLFMTALCILLGMSQEEIVTMYVLFAVPSAMNVFIMTKSMGGDDSIAANIIVSAVFLSIPTMTAGIFLLRMLHIV